MSEKSEQRAAIIPIPVGGFRTNEDEARWLEQTILLRAKEMMAVAGVTRPIAPKGLYDLLLLSLNAASKRGARQA
jgi:hypothetical protein